MTIRVPPNRSAAKVLLETFGSHVGYAAAIDGDNAGGG
jgi:hypothetical protein